MLSSPPMIAQRGPFVSVQVNVNGVGNNIVGDAANEPSIAIDPTNPSRIVIGWRQFDTIASNFREAGWAYSHNSGVSWTFPGAITNGTFRSDPVLDCDTLGNFYYYSLSSTTSCEVFKSTNGGVSWGPAVPAWGGDKNWMAIDRTGGIGNNYVYVMWREDFSCCGINTFARSINGAGSFQSPVPVSGGPILGTIAVGPDGEVYETGIRNTLSDFVVTKSTNAEDPGMTPSFGPEVAVNLGGEIIFGSSGTPNPAGLLGQAWVAVDHSTGATRGNVYLLGTVDPAGSDPAEIMFSRSEDGGQTWSAPVRVNDDTAGNNAWQWFGTLSVAPNGRLDVIWNDTRNSGGSANLSEVFYSHSDDAGVSWSASVAVSPQFNSWLGWPQQNKIGDYYHMISDNSGASLAYSATFNGEQDVYFLRIPTVPPICEVPSTPLAAGSGCTNNGQCNPPGGVEGVCVSGRCHTPFNRYLTFLPPTPIAGHAFAIRVTFASMPGSSNCPLLPDYSAFQGDQMWLGIPDATGTSRLISNPVYRDWGTGQIKVSDCNIVPCGSYTVEAISSICTLTPANFSGPLSLATASRFGDVSGTNASILSTPDGQAGSFIDIGWIVDRFKGLPNIPEGERPRVDLCKNVPTNGGGPIPPTSNNVDFQDISCAVSAFQGLSYDVAVRNAQGQHGPAGSEGTCALP